MLARSLLLIGSSMLVATAANAHTINILGTNADAIACYRAAEAEIGRSDVERTCTAALESGELTLRDQMATHVNRGIVRFRLQNIEGAISDFDSALAMQPNQPDAMINKGIAMLAGGASVDSALALIDQGLEAGPQRPWVGYYGRAVAHELAGRDAQAYRAYRRAQELRPGWRPAEVALTRFSVRG